MEEAVLSEKQKGRLMIVLSIALIFSAMNTTMFNIALPSISNEFNLSESQVSWVVTSYMIVYAIGSVVYGRLADQYKLKTLLTIGIVLFAVGSIVGFFASTYSFMIVGRIIQAMGAAIFPSTAMLIPVRYFPATSRGRALGITSAGLVFGIAIGPIIAGLLTTYLSWHYLYVISVVPIFTIPFFYKYLDDAEGVKQSIDYFGALMLALTIASWLLGITNASLFYTIAGCLFLIAFVWRIMKAQHPFIQPSLFKNKLYTISLVIWGIGAGVGFGIAYLTPMLFSDVHHISPLTTGLLMFPGAALAAVLSKRGGMIADTKGNQLLAYISLSCLFICFLTLTFAVEASEYFIVLPLIFGYVGQTFYQLAMANTISQTLPKEQAGTGMGLFMLVNFVVSSIAATLMGKALTIGMKFSNVFATLTFIVILIALIYTVINFRLKKGAKAHKTLKVRSERKA